MRHGQTVWNAKGIYQGRSQNRLSELGKQQVAKAREEIKDKKIDLIFCSPLMRTVQTTNIFNVDRKLKVIKDERLIEVDKGIFTGRVKNLTEDEKKLKDSMSKELGMENYADIYNRTKDFIEYIKQNYSDKTILVITHGIIAAAIDLYSQGKNCSDYKYDEMPNLKNAEIRKIEI